MASSSLAIPQPLVRPMIRQQRTRFLLSWNHPEKWWKASNPSRLSIFALATSRPLHLPFSICSHLFLSPPIHSLFQPSAPPFRSPFSSMTSPQASLDASAQSSNKTVRVVVKGRVQGVFYRNWTVENAKQLGLNGWVRNRRDGSVEALFSGNPDAVKEMEQRCRRGPPAAMVTGFDVFPCNDDPGTGFECKQTV